MRWMRTTILAGGTALLAAAIVVGVGQATAGDAPEQDARQVAWKQKHIENVVDELGKRAPADLTPEQQAARKANIDRLAKYGVRGLFPIDHRFRGLSIPYLIDDHGTRCALAHLIDRSGHNALLLDLAKKHNNAFVPELSADKRLHAWLREQGLTIEDAALIQGPGFVDPVGRPVTDPGGTAEDPIVDSPITDPTGGNGVARTRRRPTTASAGVSWEQWWSLNRHAHQNLRAAYHDAVVTGGPAQPVRPHRPNETEIRNILLPLFQEQANNDEDIRATALMAWTRAVRGENADEAVKAVLKYIGSKDATYREILILALGVSGHESGYAPLVEIVKDTPAGRRLLRSSQSLNDRSRAFAAIALGELGDARATPVLLSVLAKERRKAADLRSCCIAALGQLAPKSEAVERTKVNDALLKALQTKRWPDHALAAIPAALASSDSAVSPKLVEQLARFRKPHAARQSAALALPLSEMSLNNALADTLIGTIRRDPDDMARRFALLSMGELSSTIAKDDAAVRAKLRKFYDAAFRGVHVKSQDRPWMYLSAAFFARACPDEGASASKSLLQIVRKGSAREHRASACVALAVLGDASVVPELRKLLAKSGDDRLRGYLAESLGILRDRESQDKLLKMVREDKSDHVKYHAAVGLGFLADRTLVPSLVEALKDAKSFSVKAALTRIIGEVGDRSALLPLMKTARDKKMDTWTRRRALAALGMIAEEADEGWTASFRRGANLLWVTPTMREVLGIF